MGLHSWQLQKTIYSTLESANITDEAGNAITGVFDDVPEGTVSGALGINIKHEFDTEIVEGDGITRHGIMRFRAVVSDS